MILNKLLICGRLKVGVPPRHLAAAARSRREATAAPDLGLLQADIISAIGRRSGLTDSGSDRLGSHCQAGEQLSRTIVQAVSALNALPDGGAVQSIKCEVRCRCGHGLCGHRAQDRQVPAGSAGKLNFCVALSGSRLTRSPNCPDSIWTVDGRMWSRGNSVSG